MCVCCRAQAAINNTGEAAETSSLALWSTQDSGGWRVAFIFLSSCMCSTATSTREREVQKRQAVGCGSMCSLVFLRAGWDWDGGRYVYVHAPMREERKEGGGGGVGWTATVDHASHVGLSRMRRAARLQEEL